MSIEWERAGTFDDLAHAAQTADYSNDTEALLAVPQLLIERALRVCGDYGNIEASHAYRFVMHVVRGLFRPAPRSVLWLVEAMDLTREHSPDIALDAAVEILRLSQPDLRQRMKSRSHSDDDLKQNALAVVEDCYYFLEAKPTDLLVGSALHSAYRTIFMRDQTRRFDAVLAAGREVYGFLRAGEKPPALRSLDWCRAQGLFVMQADKRVRDWLIESLIAAALAAEDAEYHDACVEILLVALDWAPDAGSMRARVHTKLGLAYKRLGLLDNALRMFEAGTRVASVDDRVLGELRTELSMLRAELENSPEQMEISHFGFDGIEHAGSVLGSMQAVLIKKSKAEPVTDEEYIEVIASMHALIQGTSSHTLRQATKVNQAILLLSVALSMRDPSRSPVALDQLLMEAEALLPSADSDQALRLNMLRKDVNRYEALKRIQAIRPWNERMDALGLLLKTHLVQVAASQSPADWETIQLAIDIANEGVTELIADAPTTDVATLCRASFGEVSNTLITLIFTDLARQDNRSLSEGIEIVLDAKRADRWRTINRLMCLLQEGSQWMLRVAAGRKLAASYAALPPVERSEWEHCRTAFADQIVRWHFDPSFSEALSDRRSELWQNLDRIRYYGTLAQLDRSGTREVGDRVSQPLKEDAAVVFHTLITPAAWAPTYGFLVMTAECAVLWTSAAWSEWVKAYLQADEQDKKRCLAAVPQCSLAQAIAKIGISTICINDLTRGNIPLELAIDPAANRVACMTSTANTHVGATRHNHRLQFWGGFEYGRRPAYTVDDQARELRWVSREGAKGRLAFPAIPSAPPRFPGRPKPLPLSHFERWALADIADAAGVPIQSSWDRSSRQAFLDQDWSTCDILHVATHGEAFSEVLEGSHLVLGNARGLPDCVTFADILSIDWSGASLVFLNCCVTEVGRQTYGDDRLSLAWAFLAGGARSVIGHRWRVDDGAAYLFAKHFYASLFLDRAPC